MSSDQVVETKVLYKDLLLQNKGLQIFCENLISPRGNFCTLGRYLLVLTSMIFWLCQFSYFQHSGTLFKFVSLF